MPSILAGYEYDIFISYRQNDNRYDGWVKEFVTNLKAELEATVKGNVTIYFDENPSDGLLESHNVDASLSPKLRALILIPIVSQTYCDPDSFAWNQEFLAFLKIVSNDKFGLTVRLSGGNVGNRILPVRIHELDEGDVKLYEDSAGTRFRPIDFIYKEPGVNRPLRANEESPTKNLNQTLYRNQINKVANAVKDIITGLRNAEAGIAGTLVEKQTDNELFVKQKMLRKTIARIVIGLILVIVVSLFGYRYFNKYATESKIELAALDKSIAVIPFVDMSQGHDHEYFADGMMDEILNHLYKIGDLRIPSRTTSMKYKNTHLGAKEIGQELGVAYILEGSVRTEGEMVRITVQLIDTKKDQHEWSEDYDRPMLASSLLAVQSDVAQQIARILKARISPEVRKSIEHVSTENTSAYTQFLKFKSEFWKLSSDQRQSKLEEILKLDPNYAPAMTSLGLNWIFRGSWDGDVSREQVIETALPLLKKSLELDSSFASTHGVLARFYQYFEWNFAAAQREYDILAKLEPANKRGVGYFNFLYATGQKKRALEDAKKIFDVDNNESFIWEILCDAYAANKQCKEALKITEQAMVRFPDEKQKFEHNARHYKIDCAKEPDERKAAVAYMLQETEQEYFTVNDNTPSLILADLAIKFYKNGQQTKTKILLDKLVTLSGGTPVRSPSFFTAKVYAAMGKVDLAFKYLDRAYSNREVEMYWLKAERNFESCHADPRWKVLIQKMKFPDIHE